MNVQHLLCSAVVCLLLFGCTPAETQSSAVITPDAVTKVAETPVEPKAAPCQLKLGFESWEPYQYVGLEQQASGLDIEIVQAVAGRMNCTLVLQHGANKITAEGEVTDKWQMALSVVAPDLASSIQGAQGSLMADAKVTGPQQHPALDIKLQGEKLRYKKLMRLQNHLTTIRCCSSNSSQDSRRKVYIQSSSKTEIHN